MWTLITLSWLQQWNLLQSKMECYKYMTLSTSSLRCTGENVQIIFRLFHHSFWFSWSLLLPFFPLSVVKGKCTSCSTCYFWFIPVSCWDAIPDFSNLDPFSIVTWRNHHSYLWYWYVTSFQSIRYKCRILFWEWVKWGNRAESTSFVSADVQRK